MRPIAHIETPYRDKFGTPRQSGLVDGQARIVFSPDYRQPEALRGIEGFDYLWLLWLFDRNAHVPYSPTVRPPRLGGNSRVGVFATRSPYRPNPIGLSSVRLLRVETLPDLGPTLLVAGADLVSGTPILDIKPYLPYTDAHPDARSGFAPSAPEALLLVDDPDHRLDTLDPSLALALRQALAQDPRPHYHDDPSRTYHMLFAHLEVHFRVEGDHLVIAGLDVK